MFDCTAVPIIDYFAGVWGHTKHDDCSKLQNRALRYFLGVGPKTPIPALHGEVNWVSPFLRHVACITKLWNRTIMMNEQRLPLKVLKYMSNNNLGWVKRVKSMFLELDLDITSNDISHIPLQTVKEHLVKKDTHQWKLSVASKPKLRTYALFKINLKTELYVSLLIPKCKRSIFCQFRSGILPLAIETGRYRNVPADERLCAICNLNLVEDEIHFLCFCHRYQELRTELYQNVLSLDCLFPQYTDTEKLRILMDDRFVKLTINFIYGAWQIRQNVMFNKNTYFFCFINITIFILLIFHLLVGLFIHVSNIYVLS